MRLNVLFGAPLGDETTISPSVHLEVEVVHGGEAAEALVRYSSPGIGLTSLLRRRRSARSRACDQGLLCPQAW